ncbi:hypothetical protein H6F51_08060 [Cyanobacteria bacterium FACHB-DQ100]|nr:hypothetical protein [Cyanobacteria bacterium FACHB-DQ100]
MLRQIGVGVLATAIAIGGATTPVFSQSTQPTVAPAPEAQFSPKAQATLSGDRVNVTLINQTNAAVLYQAIGDTQVRTLPGRGTVTLRGLRVPTTLTFDRQDAGLLNVTPKQSATLPGTIEVTLNATTNLATDSITMRVENNGSVFLY